MEEAVVIRAAEQQATVAARILWIVLNHRAGFHHATDIRRQDHAFGTRHLAERVRQEENLQRRSPADLNEDVRFSRHWSDWGKQTRPLRRACATQSGGEQGERKPVERSRAEFHAAK